jgi:hypothetical protein
MDIEVNDLHKTSYSRHSSAKSFQRLGGTIKHSMGFHGWYWSSSLSSVSGNTIEYNRFANVQRGHKGDVEIRQHRDWMVVGIVYNNIWVGVALPEDVFLVTTT